MLRTPARYLPDKGILFRNLGLKARLRLSFFFMIGVIVLGSALSFFGAERTIYYLERSRLAHEQLHLYVSIAKKSNWLLRNLYQNSLASLSAEAALNDDLIAAIRTDVASLNELTREEVAFVGLGSREAKEEAIESIRLVRIENGLEQFLIEFEKLKREAPLLSNEEVIDRLGAIAMQFDKDFMFYVADILADERDEVRRTDEQAQSLSLWLERLTTANALLSLPIILLLLVFLTRVINRALDQLTQGAQSLSLGNMDHRIPRFEDPELDQLGQAFNNMAEELSRNRAHLIETNNSLEQIVQERTKELEAANQSLGDADRLRRRFFADISHELRTPLTVIRGEAEITLRGGDKSVVDYQACLSRIVDQSEHTTQLVDDLLFMARANAGQPRMQSDPVVINDVLRNAVDDFQTTASSNDVQLYIDISMDQLVVLGDRRRLRQVFTIILDNAIRYSSEHGAVHIRSSQDMDRVVITIEDNGIGIAKEELDHVFERFYRGNNAVKSADGTGLGLPVAKAIIEAHFGQVQIDSALGEGAIVTIQLPVQSRLRSVA